MIFWTYRPDMRERHRALLPDSAYAEPVYM